MKKHFVYLIAFVAITSLMMFSCGKKQEDFKTKYGISKQEIYEQAMAVFKPLPSTADNPDNVLNDAKIELGKELYFETALSINGTQSCNSCHNLETFGVDNLPTSPGAEGQNGNRNSPTVLNAALHTVQFWDGRAKDVEEQAGGPIVNPVEMGMPNHDATVDKIKSLPKYRDMFVKAFPDESNPITYTNLTKAIGAFERTLLTPSQFDEYLAGNQKALSDEELLGMKTFVSTGCTACHSGALLGGDSFQKFGVMGDYWKWTSSQRIDIGRAEVTSNDEDKYFFKVPSLRNIDKTAPYFHDGTVSSLEEAVKIMGKIQTGKDLSGAEVDGIITFLKALTGEVPKSALPNQSIGKL